MAPGVPRCYLLLLPCSCHSPDTGDMELCVEHAISRVIPRVYSFVPSLIILHVASQVAAH